MFGKPTKDTDQDSASIPQFKRAPAAQPSGQEASELLSTISADVTIVGKISGKGTVNVLGRIEGELHASTVVIAEGGEFEGEVVADDLTIGGRVKGTIHGNRVRLNGTAVVQGDIFHRSLAIEENARFEGSSRREDNAGQQPAQLKTGRAQPAGGTHEGNGKLNGTPDKATHAPPVT